MATTDLNGAPAHADHPVPVRLTGSPNWHYAYARRALLAAGNVSEQIIAAPAAHRAELKAVQDSYYLLAAAHRRAAQRRERAEKFWATRPGTLIRLAARGVRIVRSAVAV